MYADLYHKEMGYWWHRGKRWMLHEEIRAAVERSAGRALVVDLGCGTGALIDEVNGYACGIGVDGVPEALEFCRKRGLLRLCAADLDTRHLPFSDKSVDVVVLADCLEHSKRDVALLRECARILTDDGMLIVVVPAYQWLWSYWDVIVGHYRRYTWTMLRRAIADAGLVERRHTYLLMFLLPIAALWRAIRQAWFGQDAQEAASEFVALPGLVNDLLLRLYRLETRLSQYVSLPFGLSIMAVCAKGPLR